MITTGDIANILYRDALELGIPVYKEGAIPLGEVTAERITIHVKKAKTGMYWKKAFADVNICVPDRKGMADLGRLTELERIAEAHFDQIGQYDRSRYTYSVETSQENDESLKCHFVNCNILFEILNV